MTPTQPWILFALAGALAAQTPWTATLRLRVLDDRGEPVTGVGAMVGCRDQVCSAQALRQPHARSNADGVLQVELHGDGTANWWRREVIALAALQRLAVCIEMPYDAPTAPVVDCGVLFLPRARARRGRVRDANGKALAGVRVEARAETAPQWVHDSSCSLAAVASAETDADGICTLEGCGAGTLRVAFSKPGWFAAGQELAQEDAPLAATLEPGGFVTGTLTGLPAAAADLRLMYEAMPAAQLPPQVAADGTFRIPVTGRGRLRVLAHDGRDVYCPIVGESAILAGPGDGVRIDVAQRTLRVRATIDGAPATVFAVEPLPSDASRIGLTFPRPGELAGAGGKCEFTVPQLRRVEQLLIMAPGRGAVLVPVTGDEVACELPPAVAVSGVVQDTGGKPVAGAAVFALLPPPGVCGTFHRPRTVATSAADGSFRIEVPAGSVVVQVDHPDYAVPPIARCNAGAGNAANVITVLRPAESLRGQLVGAAPGPGWTVAPSRTRSFSIGVGDWVYQDGREARAALVGGNGEFALQPWPTKGQELVLRLGSGARGVVEVPLGTIRPGAEVQGIAVAGLLPGTVRGRVACAIPGDVRAQLRVVATPIGISAPVIDGRYELLLPAGDHRLSLADAVTGLRVCSFEEPVHVGTAAATERDLAASLHRVELRLDADRKGRPLVDAFGFTAKGTRPDSPPGEWLGLTPATASIAVLLPDGVFVVTAWNHAGYLRPRNGVYTQTQLGTAEFEVRGDTVVRLPLLPPPGDDELK